MAAAIGSGRMPRPVNAERLAKTLRRHLARGWKRAVFAEVGEDAGEPEVFEEPADETPSDDQIDRLITRAVDAAHAGRVKQTFIIDDRTRVRIDARFGKAKVQSLDDATVSKMMGGKDRPLRPDVSGDLLRTIGIMNADGTISTKHAKKYKQVNHFVELCRPVIERIGQGREVTDDAPLRVLDLGCGNAYLTFVLAEALRLSKTPASIRGVDVRSDVIERSRRRADELGWKHLTFDVAPIDQVKIGDPPPDLVMALHACDTATDDALALGVRAQVAAMLVAPCCQHELAGQLDKRTEAPLPALVRHGLFKQDYAALLTDALRVEILEACGYKVDVLEFVASEHTPKNILLRVVARHPGKPPVRNDDSLRRLGERCRQLGVDPKLLRAVAELSNR
jgi:SAM-dependent methyltransferase